MLAGLSCMTYRFHAFVIDRLFISLDLDSPAVVKVLTLPGSLNAQVATRGRLMRRQEGRRRYIPMRPRLATLT